MYYKLSMEANVTIELDEIWGDSRFEQREWGDINYFIGPNGTGKTLFAEALNHCLTPRPVRYLSAERLTGLNPERYSEFYRSEIKEGFDIQKEQRYHDIANQIGLSSDAYVTLRNRLDLKVKIQAILSQFFDRDIELTVEGRYLTPKMRDISSSTSNSYDLREDESHGLKELISLLTIIHNDEYNVLIIDEPELHLHPQYQKFLLREIRKVAGPPDEEGSRTFFLITHSPSMIEIRGVEDLKNIYSFRRKSRPPYTARGFSSDDEYHIKKLIPRLNTRHKEVLFSKEPVLVEGYTDEEIFSLAIENHGELAVNPESELMGVGGKERLNSFFLFCREIGLQPRVICDLDTLFSGNLRQTFAGSGSVNNLVRSEGIGSDLMDAIGDIESELTSIVQQIRTYNGQDDDLLALERQVGF